MRARVAVLAAFVALGGAAVGCTSGHHDPTYHATMIVSPATARFDQPFTMTLRGIPAGTTVEIDASAVGYDHLTWTSKTTFHVPANGVLTFDAPAVAGGYTGVNTLGPLVTMQPPPGSNGHNFGPSPGGTRLQLAAVVGGQTVATGTTVRQDPFDAVTDTPLRPATGGLYGELYTPKVRAATTKPGIVMFGGSEGGDVVTSQAAALAADGYPTLALAYFKEPGLPSELHDIPLEYFEHAAQKMRATPGVDPKRVVVFGGSRGGEAALLVGATYPGEVNAVIAAVPSNTVFGGLPDDGTGAWTVRGQELETGSVIPVEQIRGPILQTCATDDHVWNSCGYQRQIVYELQQAHFSSPVTTLSFAGAGHFAGPMACCYGSVPSSESGGTLAANALAMVQGNAALQAFLAKL